MNPKHHIKINPYLNSILTFLRRKHSIKYPKENTDNLQRSNSKWDKWWLPWWLSSEESTCQCRRHRFDLWSGKIPHAVKQPSSCAITTEPILSRPEAAATEVCVPSSLCSAAREVTAVRRLHTAARQQTPPSATRQDWEAMKTQHSQRRKKSDRECSVSITEASREWNGSLSFALQK